MAGGPNIDPTTNLPRRAHTFWTIQAMRAIAAAMVVIGHSQTMVGTASPTGTFTRWTALPWGAGVDLFFVISGFVMVHASRRLFGKTGAGRDFFVRRVMRVVPLYWLATAVLLLLLGAAAIKGGDPFPSGRAIAAALVFLPFDTWSDGRLMPVLDLGWTLNYEMFFYTLFALAVALPRRRAIGAMLLALLVLTIAGRWLPPETALAFWTRPILLDFALGMIVGAMLAEGWRLSGILRLALAAVAVLVFVLDPAGLFAGPSGVTVPNEWPRVLWAGLPCAALLAAAVLGDEPPQPVVLRPLTALGDASYSLYLLHPFALILIGKAMQKSGAVAALPAPVLVLASVALAIGLALAAFHGVERRTTARLTEALQRRREGRTASLATRSA